MSKTNTTISIDTDTLKKARTIKINISKVAENALKKELFISENKLEIHRYCERCGWISPLPQLNLRTEVKMLCPICFEKHHIEVELKTKEILLGV